MTNPPPDFFAERPGNSPRVRTTRRAYFNLYPGAELLRGAEGAGGELRLAYKPQ